MMTPDDDKMLDDTFAHIRSDTVPVSDSLMDRIMMDADHVLATAHPLPENTGAAPSRGLGATLLDAIGGWPSAGGLAMATVAGLWIGVAPPAALAGVTDALWGGTYEVPVLNGDLLSALEG